MGSGSCALERVRRYGVAGLFPGFQKDFPFILNVQSVPRPAWSGKRDFHGEKLHQAYEFLIREAADNTSSHVYTSCLCEPADEACDSVPA
jgi:hypothetical protein